MPSRPVNDGRDAREPSKGIGSDGKRVSIDLTQRAGAREATGTFTIDGFDGRSREFGVLQTTTGWASVHRRGRRGRAISR